MDHDETPDMIYGRLREAVHVSGYTFERACGELEYLLGEDRWRQVGPGYADINAFLRSVDFSAFNLQDKRPQLVRRIKELQPEASNRAIAEAIGVSHVTINRDLTDGTNVPHTGPDAEAMGGEVGTNVPADTAEAEIEPKGDDEEAAEVVEAAQEDDEGGEELPAFLEGEDWSRRERAQAYALYLGLLAELQPTVEALLDQPGICVPDRLTMLEHIARMDEGQRAELVRLQTSADAYARGCAIAMALHLPPPPHPRVMLLYEVRRELMALSRRVGGLASRYPDLPGAAEVEAWGAHLAAAANGIEAFIETLPKEVPSA